MAPCPVNHVVESGDDILTTAIMLSHGITMFQQERLVLQGMVWKTLSAVHVHAFWIRILKKEDRIACGYDNWAEGFRSLFSLDSDRSLCNQWSPWGCLVCAPCVVWVILEFGLFPSWYDDAQFSCAFEEKWSLDLHVTWIFPFCMSYFLEQITYSISLEYYFIYAAIFFFIGWSSILLCPGNIYWS